ncbi:putative reverse transcriptase domain-containing protein [Tanacetum coccineum]
MNWQCCVLKLVHIEKRRRLIKYVSRFLKESKEIHLFLQSCKTLYDAINHGLRTGFGRRARPGLGLPELVKAIKGSGKTTKETTTTTTTTTTITETTTITSNKTGNGRHTARAMLAPNLRIVVMLGNLTMVQRVATFTLVGDALPIVSDVPKEWFSGRSVELVILEPDNEGASPVPRTCGQMSVFLVDPCKLCNAPVLALPDGPDDFVVYCDASKQGFGSVLMQRGKVIAYASRQLKKHEKTYTTLWTWNLGLRLRFLEYGAKLQGSQSSSYVQVPLDEIEIDENLRFVEETIEIVERDVKKLKRRRIPLVKVRWNSRQGAEYTWEHEYQFRKNI